MNVTFSGKSNNLKENIDSFLFSLSLLNLIFFSLFSFETELYSSFSLESLFFSSSGTKTIKHASDMRSDYSVYFESACRLY
jgi:hypothetical protein